MIPTLETERLILRAPGQQDLDAYADFLASERSRMVGGPLNRIDAWRSLAAIVGHWSLRGFGRWALDTKSGETSLGFVGLHFPEGWPEPEIAWTLFGNNEGNGYAQEAARAARDFAYKTLNWTRSISLINPANHRSVALAKRMGATPGEVFNHPTFGPLTVWQHPTPDAVA